MKGCTHLEIKRMCGADQARTLQLADGWDYQSNVVDVRAVRVSRHVDAQRLDVGIRRAWNARQHFDHRYLRPEIEAYQARAVQADRAFRSHMAHGAGNCKLHA